MSRTLHRLSIVAPVFNERDNLHPLYERVSQAVDALGGDWELILVDDGSTDDSAGVIRELHRLDTRVKALHLSRNFGHEPACTAGLEAATGDAVVLIDGDLQDPPELIPELVAAWRAGYDIVSAKRTSRRGDGVIKRLCAYLFYRGMNRLVRWDFPQDIGNFRLMDRAAVAAFLACPERGRFVRALTAWTGFRQTNVSFERQARHAGATKYTVRKILGLALTSVTGFSNAPLRAASVLGLLITGVSLLAGLALGAYALSGGVLPQGSLMATSLWLLGGVQCLLIGVLGEYVGRIYLEVRQRPLYFVRERIGIEPPSVSADRSAP